MVKLEIFLIVVFCFHELYELQEDVIVKTMDQILIHEGTHNRTGAYINAVHTRLTKVFKHAIFYFINYPVRCCMGGAGSNATLHQLFKQIV